jgi:hypothetical protein
MTKAQAAARLVRAYKKTLNPKCKYIKEYVQDYKKHVQKYSLTELKQQYEKWYGKATEKAVQREIKKMDKAGMFDIKKMKPSDALN